MPLLEPPPLDLPLAVDPAETAVRERTPEPASTTVRASTDLDPRLVGHLPALDGVRGLAILAVTVYRFARVGPADTSLVGSMLFPVLELGAAGVELFFVLSGFLITGLLYDSRHGEAHGEHYFRNFYVRRTLRIFPLYYATLALLAAAAWLAPSWAAGGPFRDSIAMQPWLWCYGTNVHQALVNDWSGGPFSHTWSLAVEEHFYLVWPLVIWCCSRQTALRISLAVVIGAAMLRVGLLVCFGSRADVAVEALTPCRMDALALGAVIALAARGPGGLPALTRGVLVATLVGLLGCAAVIVSGKRLLTFGLTALPLVFVGVLFAALVADKRSRLRKLLGGRFLRMLGKYSYAMYVFQLPLIPLMAFWLTPESLVDTCGSALAARLVYTGLMFSVTLAAAWLSWHLLEKRFLALKDKLAPVRTG